MIKINPNKLAAYQKSISGNLVGRTVIKKGHNKFEIEESKEAIFSSLFVVDTEISFEKGILKITSINIPSIAIATFLSLSLLIQQIFSSEPFNFEVLIGVLGIWIIIPILGLFNYLFIIPTIREIKKRVVKINNESPTRNKTH